MNWVNGGKKHTHVTHTHTQRKGEGEEEKRRELAAWNQEKYLVLYSNSNFPFISLFHLSKSFSRAWFFTPTNPSMQQLCEKHI
jgi:hypothetical protein